MQLAMFLLICRSPRYVNTVSHLIIDKKLLFSQKKSVNLI